VKSVSVIVPTRNRRRHVLLAVASLLSQTFPEDSLEVIVVTDRCTDGTESALKESFGASIRVLDNNGIGGSSALNTGLAAARGEIIVTLDDDMVAEAGFVAAHVEAHERFSGKQIAVTGYSPVRLDDDATPLHHYLAARFAEFHARLQKEAARRSPASLALGNMSMSRHALAGLGGFNETYLHQRNDFELGTRLIEHNFEIHYCPAARAFQTLAVTGNVMVGRAHERGVTDVRLMREHPWCVSSLPFYRQLTDRRALRKWRTLWLGRRVFPHALGLARRLDEENLYLIRLEYSARYSVAVISAAGGWAAFERVSRAPA
jgi:glycosyltransferase involved in cell wall biosynthesis